MSGRICLPLGTRGADFFFTILGIVRSILCANLRGCRRFGKNHLKSGNSHSVRARQGCYFGNSGAVDKYAGGAFRILYRDAISGLYDARVPSRHAHIAQNNAAIRASAYCYDCVAVRKLPFVLEPARLNRHKNNKHAYRLNRPPSDFLSSRDFAVSSLLLLTSL